MHFASRFASRRVLVWLLLPLLLLGGCGLEEKVRERVAQERAQLEEKARIAAREELVEELNLQSRRLLGLMTRYSAALQALALELSKQLLRTICVVSVNRQDGSSSYQLDTTCMERDLGYDGLTSLPDVARRLQERFQRLSEALSKGAAADVEGLHRCKELDLQACDITPIHITDELVKLYPGNAELGRLSREFNTLRDEARQMLSEPYWIQLADERTRRIIRRIFTE